MMKGYLRFFVLLGLIALATGTVFTRENRTYDTDRESRNTLWRRGDNTISVRFCDKSEGKMVKDHIVEAGKILEEAQNKLKKLQKYLQTHSGAPSEVKYSYKFLSIYWTYFSIMNRLLLYTREDEEEKRIAKREIYGLIEIIDRLKRAFFNEGARATITCSDKWLTPYDNKGNPPPQPNLFWDKINRDWLEVPRGKFREKDPSTVIILPASSVEASTVFILNQYRFPTWIEVDHSEKDYTAFLGSVEWVENRILGFLWVRKRVDVKSGKFRLTDMAANHLSITLITAFAQVETMTGRRKFVLKIPKHLKEAMAQYDTEWDWITDQAKVPHRAQDNVVNFGCLLVALYLDNWDWSTGKNRRFQEVWERNYKPPLVPWK